jgi:hypothetical protein
VGDQAWGEFVETRSYGVVGGARPAPFAAHPITVNFNNLKTSILARTIDDFLPPRHRSFSEDWPIVYWNLG